MIEIGQGHLARRGLVERDDVADLQPLAASVKEALDIGFTQGRIRELKGDGLQAEVAQQLAHLAISADRQIVTDVA